MRDGKQLFCLTESVFGINGSLYEREPVSVCTLVCKREIECENEMLRGKGVAVEKERERESGIEMTERERL